MGFGGSLQGAQCQLPIDDLLVAREAGMNQDTGMQIVFLLRNLFYHLVQGISRLDGIESNSNVVGCLHFVQPWRDTHSG